MITATVADSTGKPGSDTVSVLVLPVDVTPPTIFAPAAVVVEATGQTTAVALGSASALDNTDPSPNINNNAPAAFPLGATASDLVDGARNVSTSGLGFSTATPGAHIVTYTTTDAAGNASQATRTVNVVDASTLLTVAEVNPNAINRATLPGGVVLTISGTGFTGTPTVTFLNGSGPTPSASNVNVVDGNTLTATISGSSGGPRRARVWDVLVTLPGGASATCGGCLTINP